MFDVSLDDGVGHIFLSPDTETFESSFSVFGQGAYERQWWSALEIVTNRRETSALFANIDLNDNGLGLIWFYGLVPSEIAGERPNQRRALRNFPKCDDAGVFVTHQFKAVTTDPTAFLTEQTYEDLPVANDMGLYFLDLGHPERFYNFVSTDLADFSHWYYPNEEVAACRDRIARRHGPLGAIS